MAETKHPNRQRVNVAQRPLRVGGGGLPFPFPPLPGLPPFGLNQVVDVVTKTITANLQFHQAMGQLTLQFLSASAQVGVNLVQQMASAITELPLFGGVGGVPGAVGVARQPSIILEGAAGDKPLGRFLVENTLPQQIATTIIAQEFSDELGNLIKPHLTFDPAKIELDPGQQTVVSVTAGITKEMAAGVTYHGELEVDGLPGRIIIGIRRRANDA